MSRHEVEPTALSRSDAPTTTASWVGTLLLGVLPPFYLVLGLDASWYWVGLGALAWGTAIPLKFFTAWLADRWITADRPYIHASSLGLLSATTELGAAAFFFSLGTLSNPVLTNIIAYAIGAGCTETLIVFVYACIEKKPEETLARWIEAAKMSVWVRHILLVERLVAVGGHLGARSLVCLAIYAQFPFLAAVAVLTFAVTDGLADFGEIKKWDWFSPRAFRRLYGSCASIAILEIALFALLYYWLFCGHTSC